jgi:hypothetical protein
MELPTLDHAGMLGTGPSSSGGMQAFDCIAHDWREYYNSNSQGQVSPGLYSPFSL